MSSRTKSVLKRQRQQAKNYGRNFHYKSKMKSLIKKVMSSKDKNEAEMFYREAVSIIDNLTSKKILHRNTAARRKSALIKHVNSLS